MNPAKPTRGELRIDIQALRAVAVLLVVLYHLWPGRLPGGYVGVDVFFVISGFLITAHLLREVDTTGKIKLARFWARRARRLLPAAYLVLATSAVATYFWLPQINWQQNFREIISSALYVQNWRLAADAVDYLGAENSPSVAQHYWTLSVEEQFYLVWPLLIVLAAVIALAMKSSRLTSIAVILSVVTLSSFAYSLWLTDNNPAAAYFVTPTRAWQFGAGALLAVYVAHRGTGRGRPRPYLRPLLSWAGLLSLAWCGLAFSSSTSFPGTAALVPVFGALAVILANAPAGHLSPLPLMRLRPVQVLGDISYSMYLWHWPPLVILPFVLGHDLGFWPRFSILVGTIAAALLTKRYVEDPIRFGRRFGLRRSSVTFGLTGVAAAVLVAASFTGWTIAAQASQRADTVTKKLNADNPPCFGAAAMDRAHPCHNAALDHLLVPDPKAVAQDFANYPGCWAGNNDTELLNCTFGDMKDNALPRVVVIGDSHARAILPVFVRLAEQKQVTVVAQLKSSCSWSARPLVHPNPQVTRTCAIWRGKLATWLDRNAGGFDIIVTTALASIQTGTHAQRVAGFVKAWNTMGSRGVPVVAVRDNAHWKTDPNNCLAAVKGITPDSCAMSRADGFRSYDALPEAAAKTQNGHLLTLTDFYCRGAVCPAVIGGVNVYRDKSHLTTTFTRTLAPYVYRLLLEMKLIAPQP